MLQLLNQSIKNPFSVKSFFWASILIAALTFCFLPVFCLAMPEDAQVQAGDASLALDVQELKIYQSTDKAVINWHSFSISRDEKVEFCLPSSEASTLNRITGGSLSEIYGQLKSNGSLVLINPEGVLIGPSGLIDTSGLIVSTFDLKNEEYLKSEKLNFIDAENSNASIVNQGQVIARDKDILFIAKEIENSKELIAENGNVILKAGVEITLLPKEDSLNKVKVRLKKQGSLKNAGTIKAMQAELEAAGGMPECLAVSSEGLIEATGVGEKDGKIVLLSDEKIIHSGILAAKTKIIEGGAGAKGGKVYLLADDVKLEKDALIDVSGKLIGGEVLIGGDYQGKNPQIKNASLVYMHKEAKIYADSLEKGDGGKVVLWSEKSTDWQGLISAKGGNLGGDGGLIEVSSHGLLTPQGQVFATALNGKTGVLLLDPYNITISGAATANGAFGGGNPDTFTPSGTPCTLLNTDLQTALAGANVIVTTSGGGSENGDITVSSAVTSASGNNLTLTADRNITLSANVSVTGNLALNINQGGAGGTFTLGSGISATSASTTVTGNATGVSAMAFSGPAATTVTMTGAYMGTVSGSMAIGSFSNIKSINASNHANDTIIGPDGGQTFVILDDASGGSITGILDNFISFPKIQGGSGNDTFSFSDTGVFTANHTLTINGGSGDNTFDGSYLLPTVYGGVIPNNMQPVINDPNGGHVSFVKYQTNSILYRTLITFSNIGTIEGAQASTAVNIIDDGSLSGGFYGHCNTRGSMNPSSDGVPYTQFTYEDYLGTVVIDLRNNSATNLKGGAANGFSNIQYFIGTAYGPSNTIYLQNGNYNYLVTNDGVQVTQGGDFYSARSFDNYIGGNGNDSFVYTNSSLSDMERSIFIDGGAGINAFDFRSLETLPAYSFNAGSGYIVEQTPGGDYIYAYFSNINYFYLPGVYIEWFNERIQLVTMPDSTLVEGGEDRGISFEQGTVPEIHNAVNFIVNEGIGLFEIRLAADYFKPTVLQDQSLHLLARSYHHFHPFTKVQKLIPEIVLEDQLLEEQKIRF